MDKNKVEGGAGVLESQMKDGIGVLDDSTKDSAEALEGQINNDAGALEALVFIGETLGPFFLQDPKTGNANASFEAMASLDADAAAAEWPFMNEDEARLALRAMVEGLSKGVQDDDLMWEYRRLFIGPGPKPTPPWGSVYTDRECVVFGASTLALRAWMRAHGIERTTDDKTPEDHIGLMLELMAWIARNQPQDLDEFLRLHLLTWSSHFLEQLAEAANHPFYEGLARLTHASLEGVRCERGLEIDYPRFYR